MNGLVFGAMSLLILIITAVLTAMLIRSRNQASKLTTTTDRHTPNERDSEPTNAPEQSSTDIDTERNVAYISLADTRQSVQTLRANAPCKRSVLSIMCVCVYFFGLEMCNITVHTVCIWALNLDSVSFKSHVTDM